MCYINPGEFYDCHSSNYALPEVANLSVLAENVYGGRTPGLWQGWA